MVATSLENNTEVVRARIVLDRFLKMYRIKKLPQFHPKITNNILKEFFGQVASQFLEAVSLRLIAVGSSMRQSFWIDWHLLVDVDLKALDVKGTQIKAIQSVTGDKVKYQEVDLQEVEFAERLRAALLVPLSSGSSDLPDDRQTRDLKSTTEGIVGTGKGVVDASEAVEPGLQAFVEQRKRLEQYEKRYRPRFTDGLSVQEKNKIFLDSVSQIQRWWRTEEEQRQVQLRRFAANSPTKRVGLVFRQTHFGVAAILILYEYLREEFRFMVTIDLYEPNHAGMCRLFVEGFIGLKIILQCVYGMEESCFVDTKSNRFLNSQMPFIASLIAEKIELRDRERADLQAEEDVLPEDPDAVKNPPPDPPADEGTSKPRVRQQIPYYALILIDDYPIVFNFRENQKLKAVKKPPTEKRGNIISLDKLTKSVTVIQRQLRLNNCRRLVQETIAMKARREMKLKVRGTLMKITFKRMGDKYYQVWVYSKEASNEPKELAFVISPIPDGSEKYHKFVVTYREGDTPLLNTEGLTLIDFLINKLRNGKEDSERPYFALPKQATYALIASKPGQQSQTDMQVEEVLGEQMQPAGLEPPEVVSPDQTKLTGMRDFIVDDKIAISKVKVDGDKLVEFNMYYDKFGMPQKRAESNTNYFRLQIDVDKLKKADPNLKTVMSKDELKTIVQEISKCFTLNEKGQLMVDSNKINPEAIKVLGREVSQFNEQSKNANDISERKVLELRNVLSRNPLPSINLSRNTRIFNRQHYLIIINKKESLVEEDAVSSLVNYEQYRVTYSIEIKNLSNSKEQKIYLNFSEEECVEYFSAKSDDEVIRYFEKKLSILEVVQESKLQQRDGRPDKEVIKKVILPIIKKMHMSQILEYESQNIIFYYEKALQLIQKFLLNRKFLKAFKSYRFFVQDKERQTLVKQAISIENNWYQSIVYMASSGKNFKVVLWSLRNYAEFRLKVSKEASEPYLGIKEVYAEVILKSLFFVSDQNDMLILRYNYKSIPDKINKHLALAKSKLPPKPGAKKGRLQASSGQINS